MVVVNDSQRTVDRRWAVTWPSAGRFLTAYGQHACHGRRQATDATPQQAVALAPGDTVYGKADLGVIDAGPAPAVAVATRGKAASPQVLAQTPLW